MLQLWVVWVWVPRQLHSVRSAPVTLPWSPLSTSIANVAVAIVAERISTVSLIASLVLEPKRLIEYDAIPDSQWNRCDDSDLNLVDNDFGIIVSSVYIYNYEVNELVNI